MNKILILNLIFYMTIHSFFTFGMDAPLPPKVELAIPEDLKESYEREIRKFNKYKLNDDQAFSKFLQKELSSKTPQEYLQKLILVAAPLRSQDRLMHLLNRNNYAQFYYNKLTDLITKSVEDANGDETLIFEIAKWLSVHYDVLLARRNSYLQDAVDAGKELVPMFSNSKMYNAVPQLGKINSVYITRFIDNARTREEAGDRFEKRHGVNAELKSIPSFHTGFHEESKKVGSLYQLLRKNYANLYEKILKEIHDTLRKMKIEPSEDIKKLPLKFENFPEFLPAEKLFPFVEFEDLIKRTKEKLAKKTSESEPSAKPAPKIIKQSAFDDSYIFEGEEDNNHTIIHNKKNGTVEEILKINNTGLLRRTNLKYTKNVLEWLNSPQDAIKNQGYEIPTHKNYTTEHLKKMMIERHAFSRLIDNYIDSAGIQATTQNRRNKTQQDLLISIPGKFTYSDGTEETGYFSYIIDSRTNECYHRIFEPASSKKMTNQLLTEGVLTPENPTLYDVAFPQLSKP